jgi:hypothetical protein
VLQVAVLQMVGMLLALQGSLVTRIHKGPHGPMAMQEWTVGPIPIEDGLGEITESKVHIITFRPLPANHVIAPKDRIENDLRSFLKSWCEYLWIGLLFQERR